MSNNEKKIIGKKGDLSEIIGQMEKKYKLSKVKKI